MGRVKVSFASVADWSTAPKAREFLRLLVSAGGAYVPRRYDRCQPLRHAFDPGDLDACAAFWSQNQSMILNSSRRLHAYWLAWWCYGEQGRLNSLSFSADESHYCRARSVEALLELLRGIYLWGPMAYGHVCHSSDYEAKNDFGQPTRVWDGSLAYSSGDDPALPVRLDFPSSFGFGLSWRARETVTLSADFTQTRWSQARIRGFFDLDVTGPTNADGTPATTPPPIMRPELQYPTLDEVAERGDTEALRRAQKDKQEFRLGAEWVLIAGDFRIPLRAGYFNDRQIVPNTSGGTARFNGVTVGLGLGISSVLLDIAYVYEYGEYFETIDAATVRNALRTDRVYASVIYRFPGRP